MEFHAHALRQRDNSSFTTELALNVFSRSHLLVCLRLLLRVQPQIWHTFILHNSLIEVCELSMLRQLHQRPPEIVYPVAIAIFGQRYDCTYSEQLAVWNVGSSLSQQAYNLC